MFTELLTNGGKLGIRQKLHMKYSSEDEPV